MRKLLALSVILALLAACGPQTNPTAPVVIVMTATPESGVLTATPTGSITPVPSTGTPSAAITSPTASSGATSSNLKPTNVQLVLAKQDINIRNGPGTKFDIIGGVFAGQTARVTGYQSADGNWWRVECPVPNVLECWVSADPGLTEAAGTPKP